MPITWGVGGGGGGYAPVPVDPILAGQRPSSPPASQPVPPPSVESSAGVDISGATEYRGYYYEIGQSLTGEWIWFVYIGTQMTWGISGVPIGGGTSPTQAEAMQQVTGIIDGLTDDPSYTPPPIQDDFDLGLDVPEFELVHSQPGVMPDTDNGNGNGNGTPTPGTEYEIIGILAVIFAAWTFKTKIFNKR